MEQKVRISEIASHGDARGSSHCLPAEALNFLGGVTDVYLASTAPGAIRGNHYHVRKRQVLVLLPGTAWSIFWDEGEGTVIQHRSFDGSCAVMVSISPGASQAIRNDGNLPLWLVAFSSASYDPKTVVARKVI